jgi:hypothetical protein
MTRLEGLATFTCLGDLARTSTIAEKLRALQLQVCMSSRGSYELVAPFDDVVRSACGNSSSHALTTLLWFLLSPFHLEPDSSKQNREERRGFAGLPQPLMTAPKASTQIKTWSCKILGVWESGTSYEATNT